MGTRGAYGFRLNGEDKITYNHSDSYPTYLGVKIGEFIVNESDERLKEIADSIEMVGENDAIQDRYTEAVSRFHKVDKAINMYGLFREFQGNFEALSGGFRYMIDGGDFLKASLFCEWAYIINVDSGTLEIYCGYNQNKNARGRYAKETEYFDPSCSEDEKFYGVRLVKEYQLNTIRKTKDMEKFMEKIESLGN